jgi:hypothetical protein
MLALAAGWHVGTAGDQFTTHEHLLCRASDALSDEEATLVAADSGQRVKQHPGFHKIRGVETLGEPTNTF